MFVSHPLQNAISHTRKSSNFQELKLIYVIEGKIKKKKKIEKINSHGYFVLCGVVLYLWKLNIAYKYFLLR